ncbi:unnamed protein product [Calypogeia fissa]
MCARWGEENVSSGNGECVLPNLSDRDVNLCGYCKKLAPEYEKASTTLKSHDRPIILAKVDVNEDENWPLAKKFGVKGFLTLIIFRNKGEVISNYKGTRDEAGIVDYLKKFLALHPLSSHLLSKSRNFLKKLKK